MKTDYKTKRKRCSGRIRYITNATAELYLLRNHALFLTSSRRSQLEREILRRTSPEHGVTLVRKVQL